ncbi:MAG: translocation/assembly module TamB domain-containing protein [Deltaproteobacteria bacterium]|nr:translocation/assembly module TamB domain-containing protein [Deltaproteobacteria bacterium]
MLTLLYVFRGVLIEPHLKALLERTIAANLGLQVSIGDLSGSYLSNVELRNVATVAQTGKGPVSSLEWQRLKLSYHLVDLVQGFSCFLATASIELEGASVAIDLQKHANRGKSELSSSKLFLPAALPTVRIHNSFLRIAGKDFSTSFAGISLTTGQQAPDTTLIKLRIAQWSWKQPNLRPGSTELRAEMRYSRGQFTINYFDLGGQQVVESATVDLTGLPALLPFQARLHLARGQLQTSGRLAGDMVHIRLQGDGIVLSQISALLAAPIPPFGGRLALAGQLTLPLDNLARVHGRMSILLKAGKIKQLPIDQLAFHLEAEKGMLLLKDLILATGANQLAISSASLPTAAVFRGNLFTMLQYLEAHWSMQCSDIPPLLTLAGVSLQAAVQPVPAHSLRLHGAIDNGLLVIPEGSFAIDNDRLLLQSLQLRLPTSKQRFPDAMIAVDLRLAVTNLGILNQIFTLPSLGGSVHGQLQIKGTLAAPQGKAEITAEALTYGNMSYGDLKLQVRANSQGLHIDSAILQREEDLAEAHGTVNLAEKRLDGLRLRLIIEDLHPYTRQFALLWPRQADKIREIHGSLRGAVALSGPYAHPEGTLNLTLRDLQVAKTLLGDLDLDLRLAADKVTLASTIARNGEDSLAASGSLILDSRQLEDVNLTFDLANVGAYLEPWFQENSLVSGALSGKLQANGPLLEPEGRLDIHLENLQISDNHHIDSGVLRLRSSGRTLRIEEATFSSSAAQLALAGSIQRNSSDTQFTCKLEHASLSNEETLLELTEPTQFRLYSNGAVFFEKVALAGAMGQLTVFGNFDPDSQSDLTINGVNLQSSGWLAEWLTQQISFRGLDIDFHLSGTNRSLLVSAKGKADYVNARNMDSPLSGRFNITYQDRTLKIIEFAWSSEKAQQISVEGDIPLDPFGPSLFSSGPLKLRAQLQINDVRTLNFLLPEYPLNSGKIQCALNLAGTWRDLEGKLDLQADNLSRPQNIPMLPPGPYDLLARASLEGQRLVLEAVQFKSPDLKAEVSGEWSDVPSVIDMLSAENRQLEGRLEINGSLEAANLNWLARESKGLRRTAGTLLVQGSLRGPVEAPEVAALVKLTNGELSFDFDMPSLQSLNVEAEITPEQVRLQSFSGELGGSAFTLKGNFNLTSSSKAETSLTLAGKDLLLFRNESLRLRADTKLNLKGPLERLQLLGEVAVTDGRFSRNFGVIGGISAPGKLSTTGGMQLFSIKDPPFNNMVFKVRLTARKPFKIRNNLARGAVRPDLVLSGTGELPLLSGKIYLEPTRLYLPAGRLTLESGLITFEPSDPDRPKLDLLGKASMLGYDITAVIEGPYDEPVVTLSSVPPLPDEDLLMLLLAGQAPKTSAGRQGRGGQHMKVAVFLGRDLISQLFGGDSEEAEEFILDRFDVEIGRQVSQRGEETIQAQFRIADNVLGKRDSVYLTGERDAFDYFNTGVKIVFRFR